MKLCSDFKSVCSYMMNHDLYPSLDVCFRKLLHEEQRVVTQNAFKKENDVIIAFSTQGKWKLKDITRTQCYSRKRMGILLEIVARSFVIIVNNKDTLSKSVPRVLKIIGKHF